MYKSNYEKAINNADFHPLLAILASISCDIIIAYVIAVDGKNQCLQGHVYLAWVRLRDLTTGKFEMSQPQVGEWTLYSALKLEYMYVPFYMYYITSFIL